MMWILLWLAASGVFTCGYCVGAVMGFRAGAESADKMAELERPLLERY